ncbi:MAG: ECF-type sigma factor [Verrucomicrobiales bacterium]
MNTEQPGHTLQATGLVNEACMRLLPGLAERNIRDRYDFYGAAAEARAPGAGGPRGNG